MTKHGISMNLRTSERNVKGDGSIVRARYRAVISIRKPGRGVCFISQKEAGLGPAKKESALEQMLPDIVDLVAARQLVNAPNVPKVTRQSDFDKWDGGEKRGNSNRTPHACSHVCARCILRPVYVDGTMQQVVEAIEEVVEDGETRSWKERQRVKSGSNLKLSSYIS
eukprot:6189377-Pleurochrysis_carterae.AAC.3